ncbi:hypothetical protein FEM48_Zijuj06G0086600 [Ziziphus jujuba var. spinosa]|uniref:NAD-dependent epimerase/dehydratase domain-containing protein n=1 Tax=Ziziphus jujuba var. spinosa TaxID=714518 RepID=A0A978V897_ZIZJJ|nr:hypothetical protein FEM48_Zijuj06G0086600 [Ziziphus jujuba var. spinosa]
MVVSVCHTTHAHSGIAVGPSWTRFAASYKLTRFVTDSWESKPPNRIFFLGMGFVGQFFAQELKNQGWAVSGTSTSILKKKKLEDSGYDVFHFDANEPETSILEVLKYHTHMIVSIPPLVGIGDPVSLKYLPNLCVYGNCGGEWVDEDSPTNPSDELAKLRLAAEKGWLSLGHYLGISANVFRLGGIYGPGRSAVDTIIKQEALSKSQRFRVHKQYTSRVHVEDICQALKASICASTHRELYNIVDDDPAPREEVFAYARNLIEKKWPGQLKQFSNQDESLVTVKKEGVLGEKRVSNAQMKKELGVRLLHPSYKSGLQSIVDQMENPFQYSAYSS